MNALATVKCSNLYRILSSGRSDVETLTLVLILDILFIPSNTSFPGNDRSTRLVHPVDGCRHAKNRSSVKNLFEELPLPAV
jgi:hypothetical protein